MVTRILHERLSLTPRVKPQSSSAAEAGQNGRKFRSASYLGAGLRPGVDTELGKNALCVMPRGMSADSKGFRDRRVGAALRQKYCHLELPCSQAVLELQVGVPGS
jgi:hypothetical protein